MSGKFKVIFINLAAGVIAGGAVALLLLGLAVAGYQLVKWGLR